MAGKCFSILPLAMVLILGCDDSAKNQLVAKGDEQMPIEITSPAFEDAGMIPYKYTCDGQNVSPPLKWHGIPQEAKSIAIICDDPDAPMGTWVHWVTWNIPVNSDGLAENIPIDKQLPNGTRQGITSFQCHGYGGPCPPSGTHRYYFKLYALDTELEIADTSTKDNLLNAMSGHIIAQGQLMGKYKKR